MLSSSSVQQASATSSIRVPQDEMHALPSLAYRQLSLENLSARRRCTYVPRTHLTKDMPPCSIWESLIIGLFVGCCLVQEHFREFTSDAMLPKLVETMESNADPIVQRAVSLVLSYVDSHQSIVASINCGAHARPSGNIYRTPSWMNIDGI